MSGLAEAQRELADTRAEIAELQGLIDGLEEKVRNGEEAEEAQLLGEQYGLKRLAELRQEAAERKLAKAEAAEEARRRGEAEEAARADLGAASDEVIADRFVAAVAALDALAEVCVQRETAVRTHLKAFAALDMPNVVANENPQFIIRVGDSKFEVGERKAQELVSRAINRVYAVRGLSGAPRIGIGSSPVERLVAARVGVGEQQAREKTDTSAFAELLVSAARQGEGAQR
ncbi:hypothetical protein GTY67_18960 [Streptomyces sp. SID8374]|uniref:hypothetical protein n=1 Tax=Streptomyces sp. SID8374 TaxID=2690354 RepID=UPI00136F731D|nr:hypothetical protein [Streptomyces sp. SID8374]MYX15441.1 hypothetical protein [Streptomyces sp. SID8374]